MATTQTSNLDLLRYTHSGAAEETIDVLGFAAISIQCITSTSLVETVTVSTDGITYTTFPVTNRKTGAVDADGASVAFAVGDIYFVNLEGIKSVKITRVSGTGSFVVRRWEWALTGGSGTNVIVTPGVTSNVQLDDSAFTPGTSYVGAAGLLADETLSDSVDEGDIGAQRMTLNRQGRVVVGVNALGGATPFHAVSAGSGDATVVKNSAGTLYGVQMSNINAEECFLKLYNVSSAPTAGAGTIVKSLIVPGATTGAGTNVTFGPQGIAFGTGIAFTLVTTGVDSGSTGVAANEVTINMDYN